jgi:nitrogen fixation protein NifU and related proteins
MKDALYHQAILDLAKKAAGSGRLEAPDARVVVDNPLCGDRVSLDLSLDGGRVRELAHKARGCLLCQAAASVIGARAPGADAAELRAVADQLARDIAGDPAAIGASWPEMSAFSPVHAHKSRHECVLLPFQALVQALDEADRDG